MEHHRAFNVYSKHIRSERIVDVLFFKHKYLTSIIVTPEDIVAEPAKILTDAVTANSKSTDSEQMESLKPLAKHLGKLQRIPNQKGADKQPKK